MAQHARGWYVMAMRNLTMLVLTVSLGASFAHADGKKPSACPSVVIASVDKAFPGSKITACKPEKDQFEVKLTKKAGGAIEVDIASDGKLLQIEEPVAVDKVPDVVTKAFTAKYPKANVKRAEKQTITDKGVFFELAFEVEGKTKEATFAESGAFIEEE
jgi:hypothetical protein